MIRFSVVTVFPEIIEQYSNTSILGRAQKAGLIEIKAYNLRDWANDKHHTVDDRIFGGGPGMLMKIEPLYQAISTLKKKAVSDGYTPKVIATVASGTLFSQKIAENWATQEGNTDYIILCGHYEGFDARIDAFIDYKIGVGPYILTGGELPALLMIDAVARLVPEVLGNPESAIDETTFHMEGGEIWVDGEHPQYTVPVLFNYTDEKGQVVELSVPEIFRSGHHANIKKTNQSQRTKRVIKID